MLEHRTGMFGLPLRLLAREVYDRVVAQVGSEAVALVTGEEKIVPPTARYFICTVEAMPLDRRVAFVAVDEIQLAGDRQRGHVFTDRLLHCRGLEETVFLGSDTMERLISELVPGIEIERAERFSTLRLAGPHRIPGLPERTAIVTFSMERVYELAEAVKAHHGGTAVVLGALSPRTRNAQVELYQSGEVQHLVATDAIGMGLNLDLGHVALDAVRKFDGRTVRALSSAEVGQIAGRAGRYTTDGTFGALRPLELDPELVADVMAHRFPAVTRLFWRNRDLDFRTPEALLDSLERRPHHPALIQVRGEDDQHVLATLHRDPSIARLLGSPEQVERLWEVCQVPDFRKTLTDAHVRLLRDLAQHLLGDRGALPESWVDDRLSRLDRTDGDIETLMSRIAWIRTWTYVTYRDWIADAPAWQARTRGIEDRLSDALHAALTDRFVDTRAVHLRGGSEVTLQDEEVFLNGIRVARLVGLALEVDGSLGRRGTNRVRTSLREKVVERLEHLEASDDDDFSLDDEHRVRWQGAVVGRLERGPDRFEPKVTLPRLELLDGVEKDRLRTRIQRWVGSVIGSLLRPLRRAGHTTAPVRGLLYALERGMGTVAVSEVHEVLAGLDETERKQLARCGVRVGRHTLYAPATLKPAQVRTRARLHCIDAGIHPTRQAPPSSATALAGVEDDPFWLAIGFPVVGGVAVRADVLEAFAAEARRAARRGPFVPEPSLVSRLAVGDDGARDVLLGLGFRERGGRFQLRNDRRRRGRPR